MPTPTVKSEATPLAGRPRPRQKPLSEIHAEALYKPVPPVSYDDDGYPDSDNRMAENDQHVDWAMYGVQAARWLLSDTPDAAVSSDLAVFFEQGNPRAVLCPDLSVFLRAGRRRRRSYKVWEEVGPPDLALEALSEKTWRRDVHVKPPLYQDLGIREFWLLDSIEKLPTPIVGYRLEGGHYEPIPQSADGAAVSEVLGAEFLILGGEFRMRSLATGEVVPDFMELASQHAEVERRHAEAERRIAELEAELRDRRR